MPQPAYLMRAVAIGRRDQIVQTDAFKAMWPAITRTKRNVGPFREVELTGRHDHTRLHFVADRDKGTVLLASGARAISHAGNVASANAAGVKTVLRRLREQEAATLDTIDAEVAALEERLRVLRQQRKAAVADAWGRANVVRLAEVTAVAVDGY